MKKIPFFLFLTVLAFSPLAFGTTEQWSLLAVEVLISLAFLTYYLQLETTDPGFLSTPGLVPLLLLVGWMVLQILPLPAGLVKILSPQTYHAYEPVFAILNGKSWIPLTVYRKATLLECLRISAYILFYILTIQLLSSGERLKKTVKVCAWLAVGVAVVAILQKFSSPHHIYWFRPAPPNSSPIGPWVNRSQYCGYMEMVAPLVLALFLYYRPVIDKEETLRARIVSYVTMKGFNIAVLMGIGFFAATLSVFISLGRGGIIATTLSMLFFFLVLAWKKSRFSRLFYIAIISCFILSVAWFGWQPILNRFSSAFNSSGGLAIDRFPIWQDSWQIFTHSWLTGSGFGTFVKIFPLYKTIPNNLIYDHAHSDYLELLTDGGVIGFLLVAWFMIAVIWEGWKMIRRRRDRYSILVSIGALSGLVGMLIHSISDFNMHNGADGLYFFFLCGLLVSAGNTRLYFNGKATLLKTLPWPNKKLLVGIGGLFIIAVLFGQGGSLLATLRYQSVKNIYLNQHLSPKLMQRVSTVVTQAARFDPFDGFYPFLLGDVARYQKERNKAFEYYVQAGKEDPLEGAFLQRIAFMLPKKLQKNAEVLMEKGTERTVNKDDLTLSQAQWLLEIDKRKKAIGVLKQALSQNPKLVTEVIQMLQSFSFSRIEIAEVLPVSVDEWIRYGAYLEEAGDVKGAEYFYDHALNFLKDATKIQAGWFSRLYAFYRKQKQTEKAVDILRLGIKKIPDYAPFHVWLGDYYSEEGISYRAVEEYQQALLLEPKNVGVMKKIKELTKNNE